MSVIAEDGTMLEPYVARRFVSLPLVVGKGAEARARDFLNLLGQYPQVRSAVKAIVFVGERRWNLRLADGIDVRLPEQDVEKALANADKARPGRSPVLARYHRDRHALAGSFDRAPVGRRREGARGAVQGQIKTEKKGW